MPNISIIFFNPFFVFYFKENQKKKESDLKDLTSISKIFSNPTKV